MSVCVAMHLQPEQSYPSPVTLGLRLSFILSVFLLFNVHGPHPGIVGLRFCVSDKLLMMLRLGPGPHMEGEH